MSHDEITNLLLAISLMLLLGRVLGEFFRKLRMPLVVGEIVAGIILGPTLLGKFYPFFAEKVFTTEGNVGMVMDGLSSISVVLLLFAAGMEVEFAVIRQQGKTALKTSFIGLITTLTLGYFAGNFLYDYLHQNNIVANDKLVFSLFIATAMAITALPVIARTLMDLNLFKSKIGMIIIAAAMFDDLVGWILFSVVLSMMNTGGASLNFLYTLALTVGYAILMLTVGRLLINKSLPWANKNLSWPGGILALSLSLAFLGAAFTEKIGIHAIFGAFIVGIAIGDSVHFTERAREIIHQFITNIFAPLFFVSIGFKVNFIANFNLTLVIIITVLAVCTKLIGVGLGALWGKLSIRESLAVGFGMNARGAMEIVLGLLALQAGLINEQLFVALVIMAVLTSVLAGPMLQYFLTGEMKVATGLKEIIPFIEENKKQE